MLHVLYLDESGHPADQSKLHVGVAGLVAPIQSWEAFTPRWIAILEQFGVAEPFHMMDLASRRNAYKTWTETKRRELLGALVELIVATPNIKPLGVNICMQAFNEMSEAEQLRLGNPYFIALEHCIRNSVFEPLDADCDFSKAVPRIRIILARNEGYSGKGVQLWEEMRNFDAIGVTGMFMESIQVGTPKDHAPLQAADLVAYETGKFFNYTVPHQKERRWAYKRFSSMRDNSLRHFGKQELKATLQASGVTADGFEYFRL